MHVASGVRFDWGTKVADDLGLETLARLVRQRREELGLSQKAAAAAVGMSAMTWNRVEVQAEPVKPLSYAGVERALGWTAGSIRNYLDNGATPGTQAPSRTSPDDGPGIYVASDDELLDELARRLGQRRRTHQPLSSGPETAASVTARGMVPGLPLDDPPSGADRAGGSQT